MSTTLPDLAAEVRRHIDAALDGYARFAPGCPPHLQEAIRYSLLAPGKRLRPMLVLWSAEACGCDLQQGMPVACAVEMIHAYSLVHDDLPAMDDDDLRRGRPTCHKMFGEATAILVGDALLTLAFGVVAKDVRPAEVSVACAAALAEAAGAAGMVGGQADDLAAEGQGSPGMLSTQEQVASLESIHERKTGAMFTVSTKLGGLVAGANAEQLAALDTYGRRLGLAFQIADDLLDVEGSAAEVGKRVGKDARVGKLTFPGLLSVEESRRRAARLVDEACAAIDQLRPAADKLTALAQYVLKRNH